MSTPDLEARGITEAAEAVPAARSKRGGIKRVAIGVLVLGLLGCGGYAWFAGLLPFASHAAPQGPPQPALALTPDSTPARPHYKPSYLGIEGAFTTNLQGSPRFVQVEIGVATNYDPIVLAHVSTHQIPIRSAVLAILAEQTEAAMTSTAGRNALQLRLRGAINRVLMEKEGFGGISDVYLTSMVIQ